MESVSDKISGNLGFATLLYCRILRLTILGLFSVFTKNTGDTKAELITKTLKDIAIYRIVLLELVEKQRI